LNENPNKNLGISYQSDGCYDSVENGEEMKGTVLPERRSVDVSPPVGCFGEVKGGDHGHNRFFRYASGHHRIGELLFITAFNLIFFFFCFLQELNRDRNTRKTEEEMKNIILIIIIVV
jgi:hypothetical protein